MKKDQHVTWEDAFEFQNSPLYVFSKLDDEQQAVIIDVLRKDEVPMAHFIFNAAVSGIAVLLGRLKGRLGRRSEDTAPYYRHYEGPEPEVLCQLMDQMKDAMRLHRTSDFIHRALDTKLRTRKNAPAYIAWRNNRMPDLPDDPATLQIANEIYIETMKILSEINELQVACYKNTRFDRTSKRLDRLIVASQDNHRRFCDELQSALLTSIMYHNDSADVVLSEQSMR